MAIIAYFVRTKDEPGPRRRSIVAASLSLLGLALSVWITLANFPLLVGDVNDAGLPIWGGLSIGLLALVAVAILLGVIQALAVRSTSPRIYRGLTEVDITA